MEQDAGLSVGEREISLPVVVGSEGEQGVDVSRLRAETGYITLDPGYGNTGSCRSSITFIDGEKGVLRYRGYPIEQLAEQSIFPEVAWLLIFGELPTGDELASFRRRFRDHQMLYTSMVDQLKAMPPSIHPMATLSAMINAESAYHAESGMDKERPFADVAAEILSKARTIAAVSHKTRQDEPVVSPRPDLGYAGNFLHMLFSRPYDEYEPDPDVSRAMDMILTLHADHEQNCSTSTVRMVASSGVNLFASCAAGVSALWGPLHGGANAAVIRMLEQIRDEGIGVKDYLGKVKDKTTGIRLMGFGHRVYKNYDPRAKIIKAQVHRVLDKLGRDDPLLDLARELESAALEDEYFQARNLYPNVDFYSGILMRSVGIPIEMFTVVFALGRLAGWVANFKEVEEYESRIYRPRQIYTGPNARDYLPVEQRPSP